jgi:hypothetical protein
MKIKPIFTGIPQQEATDLLIRVMPFETDAKTCSLYWAVSSEEGQQLSDGNLGLTEQEFAEWGQSNLYIEELALEKLGLTRKID